MYCRDGTPHQVVDPEDPSYDPTPLTRYDETAGPRPNMLWSYCAKCGLGFRWSVHDQQWRPWPGGLALLPHLMDEELDELHTAVIRRMQELSQVLPVSQATGTRSEVHYKLRILMSLSTAVAEARYGLFPPEGPYEPRLWGEAWDRLETWLDGKIAIFEAAPGQAANGAALALGEVKAEMGRMRASDSEDLLARRIAELETSRPEPGSAESS
jgi:hypothetical protein